MKKVFVFFLMLFSLLTISAETKIQGRRLWSSAYKFCDNIGLRLPTSAEIYQIVGTKNEWYWTNEQYYAFNPNFNRKSKFDTAYGFCVPLGNLGRSAPVQSHRQSQSIGNLVWSNPSYNAMNWNDAINYCKNLTEGGYSDWRLPNIDELRTTIKNCYKTETGGQCKVSERSGCLSSSCSTVGSCYCDGISNNGGYYSKLGDDNVLLWSSSTFSDSTGNAWFVGFGNGVGVSLYYKDGNDIYVRCVR